MNDVTINEVAARTGMSRRTISRVINGSDKVNAKTRLEVQAAIAAMEYRPNARARALATGRSFLIGLVHDDPKAQVLDAVQRGLTAILGGRGYELVVHPCSHASQTLVADVRQFVERSRIDGLILLPPVSEVHALQEDIAALCTPAVSIASVPIETRSMLVAMERDAARRMTEHLIGLGHQRIAFVSGPSHFLSAQQRREGFIDALAAAGLKPLATAEGDYSFDSGLRCGRELLKGDSLPTAIFASNDFMAAGVMKAAGERGLRLPSDLSVAGFDDNIVALMLSPTLTTINRPMRQMAELAATQLLELIESGSVEVRPAAHIPLEIIERESTAPAP